MKISRLILLVIGLLSLILIKTNYAQQVQEGPEQILYFQMEPLDDSLFIHIQQEVFIDPPDPKAEIIVDLRDKNNQTVSIKGALYPFLAFSPEIRAKIITYPFKINLGETINYGSVFTKVFSKIRFNKIVAPPTTLQISPTLGYINPFFQLFGGERLGIPLKQDLGLSFGIGTPYSGPIETNMAEVRFHILGFYGGVIGVVDALNDVKKSDNQNNIYFPWSFDVGYVIPFGNFFEINFVDNINKPTENQLTIWRQNAFVFNSDSTIRYKPKIVDRSYFNWELRYPVSVFGSTRGKFYVAQYLQEWHIGFSGRELSLAGSTFDLSFDIMPKSDVRQPQYVLNVMVQKIAESWAFSAFAIGPSVVLSTLDDGSFGVLTLFFNLRFKLGTSF
jgi:hypothetical protein